MGRVETPQFPHKQIAEKKHGTSHRKPFATAVSLYQARLKITSVSGPAAGRDKRGDWNFLFSFLQQMKCSSKGTVFSYQTKSENIKK